MNIEIDLRSDDQSALGAKFYWRIILQVYLYLINYSHFRPVHTLLQNVTNTTYEIKGDQTQQERVVHRVQILEYFPKEKEIQRLTADYTTVYAEPEQFYDNYNRQI